QRGGGGHRPDLGYGGPGLQPGGDEPQRGPGARAPRGGGAGGGGRRPAGDGGGRRRGGRPPGLPAVQRPAGAVQGGRGTGPGRRPVTASDGLSYGVGGHGIHRPGREVR